MKKIAIKLINVLNFNEKWKICMNEIMSKVGGMDEGNHNKLT
jgi:hypothetical protein